MDFKFFRGLYLPGKLHQSFLFFQLWLEEKIRHCEDQYRELFMPVVYKMTSAVSGDLDDLLEKKGYPVVKYVDVLYRSLEDWNGDLWTDLGRTMKSLR